MNGTLCRSALIFASLIASGCEVPPLQVTPQPRQNVVEAPRQLPAIPAADPSALQLPQGYKADVLARDLVYPTSIESASNGDLYIAEGGYVYGDHAAPCRIWRVTQSGQMTIAADALNGQLNAPITDLLWHDNQLYISHKGKISVLQGNQVKDLVTDLPSLGDHFNNQLAAGPDGKIYFGQGAATNSGVVGVDNFVFGWLQEHPAFHDVPAKDIAIKTKDFITLDPFVLSDSKEPPLVKTAPFNAFGRGAKNETIKGATKANGTILRMNPDGSQLEVYAWGLRNPFGLCFAPDGTLYAADNGYDERGSRPIANAPDILWLVRQNGWYGFPDFVAGKPVTDPQFKPRQGPSPDFILKQHPSVEQPHLTFQHQSGVTKLESVSKDGFAPAGTLFLATFGDMSPITGQQHAGHEILRIDPGTKHAEPFITTRTDRLGESGFEYAATPGLRRPVDVRLSSDGNSLYIVDMGAITVIPGPTPSVRPFPGSGVIWRISKEGANSKGPTNLSPLKNSQGGRQPEQAAARN